MLGYITLGTNDLDASARFYDSLFAEINVGRIMEGSEQHGYIVWAKDDVSTGFSVLKPYDGKPAQPGNGNMAAISAETPEKVQALYNKAIALGGSCEGQPGDRGNGFYAAYFRDLDGNKLNAYCMVAAEG
ncbi:MAG: VOC family protein [Marinicella sp.]|nr:VOC family protein [Xanthomonadales bacterium]